MSQLLHYIAQLIFIKRPPLFSPYRLETVFCWLYLSLSCALFDKNFLRLLHHIAQLFLFKPLPLSHHIDFECFFLVVHLSLSYSLIDNFSQHVLTFSWTVFAALKLNRDTWANEAVAQTIKTNFIFWQVRIILLRTVYIIMLVVDNFCSLCWYFNHMCYRHMMIQKRVAKFVPITN